MCGIIRFISCIVWGSFFGAAAVERGAEPGPGSDLLAREILSNGSRCSSVNETSLANGTCGNR